jgi:amidase
VIDEFAASVARLGWNLEEAEPDFSGADEVFEVIRSYLFANGKLADHADRIGETKATIQEEFRRGQAQTGAEVASAHAHLGVLWRRAVEFFSSFDLLIAPVTQVSPFPIELEYPTSVDGTDCERYIDWMRSVCRITTLGMPALSLPAGFDPDGLPVGVQLIGGPHRDTDVLSAALTLEQQLPVEHRVPPVLARSAERKTGDHPRE